MKYTNDPEILTLYARLEDISRLAERGEMAMTAFLTPRESMYAASYCASRVKEGTAFLWSGFPLLKNQSPAERRRMVLLPDYTAGFLSPDELSRDPRQALIDAGFDDLAEKLVSSACVLFVKGSRFCELTHRDYLGSVLGLGLERDVMGDISVMDKYSAYMVLKKEMADFVAANLTKVAHDTVKVSYLPADFSMPTARLSVTVRDTVASARLDCVVAALTNFSREKAQTAIKSGLVDLNYETVDATDTAVEPPCVLSVRGVGKFSVVAFDGETKKGRMRLVAEKYV